MNSVLCRSTDAALEHCSIQTDTGSAIFTEESYATAPMAAIMRDVLYDDEELHTSFEQAISARTTAIQARLNRISGPLPRGLYIPRDTAPVVTAESYKAAHKLNPTLRQRILLGCFGLICAMAGFDLMGLLMLHMR